MNNYNCGSCYNRGCENCRPELRYAANAARSRNSDNARIIALLEDINRNLVELLRRAP